MVQLPYANRREAGRVLAEHMGGYHSRDDLLVLALPRGGVPVAFELAMSLEAPLDLMIVRKLGVPGQEELAMGAIAGGGAMVLNKDIVAALGLSDEAIQRIVDRERLELQRRERAYRAEHPRPEIDGRCVILVDDGLATGSTMLVAVSTLRALRPAEIVVAVPVAPRETCEAFRHEVDAIICAATPAMFRGVGAWYVNFEQTSDDEVRDLLSQAWERENSHARRRGSTDRMWFAGEMHAMIDTKNREAVEHRVRIPARGVQLDGDLTIPRGAGGIVLFAHGSGSSRHSPRNRFVASGLNDAGLATLLFDLLTRNEEIAEAQTRHLRFDIDLLAERLVTGIDWVNESSEVSGLPIGLFGASTGAAAALVAAARRADSIAAVVSRGGRPDLAGEYLPHVQCPVMLIVGGDDSPVIELNRSASAQLRCTNRLDIIPRATHLFEEPGALEQVTELARRWFTHHLIPHRSPTGQ